MSDQQRTTTHEGPWRLAGAPISWGVCEVPGWGTQLPPERVFSEMAVLGLTATELGPIGYLPFDAGTIRQRLGDHGLQLLAAFVPLVLHRPDAAEALRQAAEIAAVLASAGAEVLVVAPLADADWSAPGPLSGDAWRRLGERLDAVDDLARARGLRVALHPHARTLVETAEHVEQIADLTGVGWCLDPGHLVIGGVDPVAFARRFGDRVAHVHLKDVDARVAHRLRLGELTLLEATRAGLFPPLGTGDGRIPEVVDELREAGYDGWVVLEQDLALEREPAAGDPGPLAAVRANVAFLERLGAAAVGEVPA